MIRRLVDSNLIVKLRIGIVATVCLAAWCGEITGAQPRAYREEIRTPHWDWLGNQSSNGRHQVLFLVNYHGMREPYELAQRFALDALVVPATGDAYKNEWDIEFLTGALAKRPAVTVIAAKNPWRDLPPVACDALRDANRAGMPLVIFGRGIDKPPWLEDASAQAEDLTDVVSRNLPVDAISFRRPFRVTRFSSESNNVTLADGYDLHWTFFTAFHPRPDPHFDSDIAPELAYALAGRIVRNAVASTDAGSTCVEDLTLTDGIELGKTAEMTVQLASRAELDLSWEWALHDRFGDIIDEGNIAIARGAEQFEASITPRSGVAQLLHWRLVDKHGTIDYGAATLAVSAPVSFTETSVPDVIEPDKPVRVGWKTERHEPGDEVIVQVYDSDYRLVSVAKATGAQGEVLLTPWTARSVWHRCRLLCLRDGLVCDERRVPIHLRVDRSVDPPRFHVITWATETGSGVERHRFARLRELGITATAPIGKRPDLARWMSRAGMRIAPTNILVPPNRFTNMATYTQAKAEEALATYAGQIARYAPLGYSLADEPNTDDYAGWRNLGAEIIHRHDPGSRVGFCGTWIGTKKDALGFFNACDFGEMYSPHHLYTPNLWLGVERDIYRSFLRDDGVYTCWTHYAPRLDHEPYSRTVPWLWLFEGMNGVSYFDSAGRFAILNNDLTTTNETRWWSEEVKRLGEGIAEQIIALRRDEGGVRILFQQGSSGAEIWARALNQINVPYRFASWDGIRDDAEANLVFCPADPHLPASRLTTLERLARRGALVVVTAPVAMVRGDDADIASVLGFDYAQKLPADAEATAVDDDVKRHQGVPANATWTDSTGQQPAAIALEGVTTGAHSLTINGASVIASFDRLGETPRAKAAECPDFVQSLFATPAAIVKPHGDGAIITLTFFPDAASARRLASMLRQRSGVPAPRERIVCTNVPEATTYLYPMSGDRVRLVGIIQDYWQTPPNLDCGEAKETDAYFHHGPQRWASESATLELDAMHHVYDVRRGKYVGHERNVPLTIQPGRPELFAFLPYRVTGLEIDCPDALAAGQKAIIGLQINVDQPPVGQHIVHVTLTDPQGRTRLADRHNVHAGEGRATLQHTIPFNATPGRWTIMACDAVTGVSVSRQIEVGPAKEPIGPTLAAQELHIERSPLDWLAGQWSPIIEPDASEAVVEVSVAPLRKRPQSFIKDHKGHLALSSSFRLSNPQITYGAKYIAVNDPKANLGPDPRRIAAPYLPGLGFNKPKAHMWYYNGYMEVFFDDVNATEFAVSRIEKVEQPDGRGRVDVTWDTPYGEVELAFAMLPNHSGVFQQLTARPYSPVRQLKVRFRSYPKGFDRGGRLLKEIDEQNNAWVLLGDAARDRAFGQGMGPGALLVLPEQWAGLDYHPNRPTLTAMIDADATPLTDEQAFPPGESPKPTREIRLHWVLWMFPEDSNANALDYMRTNAARSQDLLHEMFKLPRAVGSR